ncbi:MAG: hypothetical protein GWO38_09350, partial [Phycisphaerae bacterium]|nr:hypothetical protein [Phycisphaerae bacterium]NIP51789.1 hypothetical protein [Phycisphaerae bacterium]NIX27821.1 hypothetical protein [Phycisphaerae bacterium]
MLAEIAAIDGRYQEAEHQLSKVIATARQSQNTPGYALSKLQMVYFFSGQFQKAKTPLTESQLVDDEKDYIWGILRNDISLGLLYLHGDGNYPEAQIMGQQALELGQDIENDFFVCESLVLLLQGDIVLENLVTARERLKECDNICLYRSVGYVFYVAGTEFYSGILALITGKTAVARQHLHTELEMAVHRRDKLNVANALAAFALLYASENQTISALETYSVAQQHPFIANSHWFADVIGKRISAASANLSPAEITSAQARGKEMDIWQ